MSSRVVLVLSFSMDTNVPFRHQGIPTSRLHVPHPLRPTGQRSHLSGRQGEEGARYALGVSALTCSDMIVSYLQSKKYLAEPGFLRQRRWMSRPFVLLRSARRLAFVMGTLQSVILERLSFSDRVWVLLSYNRDQYSNAHSLQLCKSNL